MTRVVNIRGNEPFDVYIGRTSAGRDKDFGNPYTVADYGRDECIELYRKYFYARLLSDPGFRERVEALRDKTLGCHCKPKTCHGDIIVGYLNDPGSELRGSSR